jgi:hypothetical protein
VGGAFAFVFLSNVEHLFYLDADVAMPVSSLHQKFRTGDPFIGQTLMDGFEVLVGNFKMEAHFGFGGFDKENFRTLVPNDVVFDAKNFNKHDHKKRIGGLIEAAPEDGSHVIASEKAFFQNHPNFSPIRSNIFNQGAAK